MPARPNTAPTSRGNTFGSLGVGTMTGSFTVRVKKKKDQRVPKDVAKQMKKDLPFILSGGTTLTEDAGSYETMRANASRPRRPVSATVLRAASTAPRPSTVDPTSSQKQSRPRFTDTVDTGSGIGGVGLNAGSYLNNDSNNNGKKVDKQTALPPHKNDAISQKEAKPQILFHRIPTMTTLKSKRETGVVVKEPRPETMTVEGETEPSFYYASPYDRTGLVRDPISQFISTDEAITALRKTYYHFERPYSTAAGPVIDPDTGRPATAASANARARKQILDQEAASAAAQEATTVEQNYKARILQQPRSAAMKSDKNKKVPDYPLAEGSSKLHTHADRDLKFTYRRSGTDDKKKTVKKTISL